MVTNDGPSDAEGVVLNFQAPKGTKLISVHNPRGKCASALALSCKLGTLKPNQKVTLTVVVLPGQVSGVFRMRDVVGSITYDPRPSNNSKIELADIAPSTPAPTVACPARAIQIATIAC